MILAQTSQDSQVPVGPASPAPPASKKKVPWSVTVGKKISESLEDLEVFAGLGKFGKDTFESCDEHI